ncbi:MAG: hypothetical protein H6736_06200 [Alphaproteobacteria bacterium]|nr:hypothetical protein [Alphaproteobacteria bacterium]
MPICVCEPPADSVEDVYCCEALIPWSRGKFADARDGAVAALQLDPLHTPSWMLYSFSIYRRGEREEGMQLLETLADDPTVGGTARRTLRLNRHRHDRDQVHVSAGVDVTYGYGPFFSVDVPLHGAFGARLHAGRLYEIFREREAGDIGGAHLTWSQTSGTWRVQLSMGGEGVRGVGSHESWFLPQAGLRIDTRLSSGLGIGVDLGAVGGRYDSATAYAYNRWYLTFYTPGRRR